MSSSRTPVTLKPTPGFCVKSTTLQAGSYIPSHTTQSQSQSTNYLEPASPIQIQVPKGLKVFINIAYDAKVPAPPQGSEDAIQRAMLGQDEVDELNPDGWYVPVVVSEGRQDKDKAGNPSLVFDCVFNTTIKSRTLRDPEFKIFIIELALQRIEAQSSILLSRQIGTPNLASKGKLSPRTVFVPSLLHPDSASARKSKKNLIEEIPSTSASTPASGPSTTKAKGILKNTNINTDADIPSTVPTTSKPTWTWSKGNDNLLRIDIRIPGLTREQIPSTTLDLEPRRLILTTPTPHSIVDINLSLSDAEIVATTGDAREHTLTLKRQRVFDTDSAKAEWRVAEGVLVVFV